MPLQSMKKILEDALAGGYAVGYFEPWDQYSMEAIISAAEEMNSPVIIGCGAIMMNQSWFDSLGMEIMAKMGRVLAQRSRVPTALLLNEALSLDQISRGLQLGFNAVMLDTSNLPYEENITITKKVVEIAHASGACVEAELGHLPMGTEENDKAVFTDADQAAQFITRTGVDALAVSVGNVHVKLNGKYNIDFALLKRIHEKVSVPLVIHGATGIPDDAIQKSISLGVAKFNVGTVLKKSFLDGMKEAIYSMSENSNPQIVIGSRKESDILLKASEPIRAEVKRLIKLFMVKNKK